MRVRPVASGDELCIEIQMHKGRPRLIARLCLLLSLLAFTAGCGGGGMTLVAISPATATVDSGQLLPVSVSLVNDTQRSGATYALTGGGTLSSPVITTSGNSEIATFNYTAPTVTATTSVTLTATSVNTASQSASLAITVNPALAITTTTLAAGTVAVPYSATLTATGGTGALSWTAAPGTLPGGLNLNTSTGILSGAPTAFGTFSVSISVTDHSAVPVTVTQSYSIVINPVTPAITIHSLPNAIVSTAYSQQLAYTGGGSGTATWSITAGSLPSSSGLAFSASGLISGTPVLASAGTTYTFTVTVAVGTQTSAPVQLTLTVPGLPTVATTTLPSGNVGIPYSQQLAYTGGNGGAVSWVITAGSLPVGSGLTLSSSGLLSGTPTAATTYTFSVAVTIGGQVSVAQPLPLIINSLVVTSGNSASGEVGLPFSFHLAAVGGTGPYTWSLASGSAALPTGLNLNTATGVITGSVTTTTGSPFTGIAVQATDTLSATATQAMTFTFNPARGNANNSELNGQYAFLLSGFDASGKPLVTTGKFTADGAGNITGGVMDVNGTGLSAAQTNVALTAATYTVGSDNRGQLTLTTASGTATYVIALNSINGGVAGSGYMTEFDSTGQSRTGVLALEIPAAFTTASITGGYAFGLTGFAANNTATLLQRRAVIGESQFNGTGGIISAEILATGFGNTTPKIPSSAAISIGANGRGTLSFVLPSGGGTLNLAVYVVSATKFFIISIDPASGSSGTNDLLTGTALKQTIASGNFNAASLSGISVLRAEKLGIAASGAYYPDAQLGLYTFSGSGAATLAGDENAGGAISSTSLTGSYTVAANGRVTATLGTGSGLGGCTDCVSTQAFFYLVGTGQGFATDFSNAVNAGYFEPQTATGFNAAAFSGSYAIGTIEPLSQGSTYSSAVLTSTGAGAITGTQDLNTNGSLTPDNALASSYTVASTGRAAITPGSGNGSVLYIISATRALQLNLSSTNPVIQEVIHQ